MRAVSSAMKLRMEMKFLNEFEQKVVLKRRRALINAKGYTSNRKLKEAISKLHN